MEANHNHLQMKRTTSSSHSLQSSVRKQESSNDAPNNSHQNSSSALKYIRAAAKKVAGIFTPTFLFKPRKATKKAIKNGQIRGVSCKLLLISDFIFYLNSKGSSVSNFCFIKKFLILFSFLLCSFN